MATDINIAQFKNLTELQRFMDQYGLTSADVIIKKVPGGVGLVYQASAVDTQPPSFRVSQPSSASAGVFVHIYIQVEHYSAIAALTDDPATTGVSLACRTQGASSWTYPEIKKIAPDLYETYIPGDVVQSPGVEFSVTCRDTSGNSATLPTSGYYTFTV